MKTDFINKPEDRILSRKFPRFLFAVYLANFFLSFHFFLVLYINSSFLEQFFSSTSLSFLFISGAILNLILLLYGPSLINKFGNYRLTLIFIIIEAAAILGLALLSSPIFIALLFILHQAVIIAILFNLDIFLEDYTTDESKTGRIRAVYLTIAGFVLVISPTITGLIIANENYFKVYLVSLMFLIPLFFTVKIGLKGKKEIFEQINIKKTVKILLKDRDLYGVFMAQLILQFFYAWMIIYMPIYLHQNLNFSWTSIGVMFTIMLTPYIIFDIPLGSLADKKLGEKEIMTFGFIITALFVALIPFIKEADFLVWTSILFMTRVGASFIEISSESYFFKHVNARNLNTISLFRVTRPLAFIIAPALAAASLFFLKHFELNYGLSFLILAIIVLYGIRYCLMITDTK